jgi:Amt family ammonium transporter
VVLALTGVVSLAVFKILDRLNMLRVDQATELAGIDNMEHGGPAYPEFTLGPINHSSHNGYQR